MYDTSLDGVLCAMCVTLPLSLGTEGGKQYARRGHIKPVIKCVALLHIWEVLNAIPQPEDEIFLLVFSLFSSAFPSKCQNIS